MVLAGRPGLDGKADAGAERGLARQLAEKVVMWIDEHRSDSFRSASICGTADLTKTAIPLIITA
ncbi:uncharacterized protein BBA_06368 [Beauveria bassiana ARSEF 2860]|uniref:Uncharacterized protein n=1 Tax=Beauveria bassiana (strain ARSEF 2860) TaxID=655819 RepID=J4KMZ2_BEAB2|nr:uncharacterized protein BBA_06368 [Beauveria bassiana ARSEF 2860]EJP64799.1 hypothetical protein BBA_06368 [Beauveria bassiana ARSEF 2860]